MAEEPAGILVGAAEVAEERTEELVVAGEVVVVGVGTEVAEELGKELVGEVEEAGTEVEGVGKELVGEVVGTEVEAEEEVGEVDKEPVEAPDYTAAAGSAVVGTLLRRTPGRPGKRKESAAGRIGVEATAGWWKPVGDGWAKEPEGKQVFAVVEERIAAAELAQ